VVRVVIKASKAVATLLTILLLINIILNHNVVIRASPEDFKVTGYGWRSLNNPSRAYPGSSKVTYYVVLMYLGGSTVSKIYAELHLPRGILTYSEGFRTAYLELDVSLGRYDSVVLEFNNLNVSDSLSPGVYTGELRLTYVLVGGVEYSATLYVPMIISELPKTPSELIDYYWVSSSGLRTTAPSGFKDLGITFYLRVKDDVVIRNVYATLELPEGFRCRGYNNVTVAIESSSYRQGDLIELRFNGIEVGVGEGSYNSTLIINYQVELYGLTTNITQVFEVFLTVSQDYLRSLEVVNAYWGSDEPVPAYPNTSKADVSIVLLNVGTNDVYGLNGKLIMPDGFTDIYGSNEVNFTDNSRLSPGSLLRITVGNVVIDRTVKPGVYMFKLIINYSVGVDGSLIRVSQELNFSLPVLDVSDKIGISNIRWSNNYGVAFPGSRGEVLEIMLSNWDEYPVSLVKPYISLPKGINLTSVNGNCFNGIPAYSTCSLQLTLDIAEDLSPGTYGFNLTLKYLIRVGNSDVVSGRNLTSELRVWDPKSFGAMLKVSVVQWGDINNPRIALPGDKLLPLTVELVNVGKDVATGVIADIKLPKGFKLTYPSSRPSCDRIERGTSCTLRFYIDIDVDVSPGTYKSILSVEYVTYFNTVNLSKTEVVDVNLSVGEYPRELRLYLVWANWSNNWPAYPGDKAVLSMRLANLGPHTISSVIANLELPKGFICEDPRCEAYYPGPLQAYQQFNLTFNVRLSNDLRPGSYSGKLILDYIVQTGGYGIRLRDTHNFTIYVSNISNTMKLVGIYWVNMTPSVGDVGLLRIILRCEEIPTLNGLVLKLELPKGVYALPNNSSVISIPYAQSLQPALIPYISGLYPQTVTPSITQGDIIFVDVPVRILDVVDSEPHIGIHVNFLDHWNTVQEFYISGELYIGNKFRIIMVEPVENEVVAGSGLSRVKFNVTNLGDSQIFNLVVVAVSPYPGISIADPIKHVDVVNGRSSVVLSFNAVANPDVVEGPYPLVLVMVFQDFNGRLYNLNISSTVVVKGIEVIKLLSPQISPEVVSNGSMVTYSATIVNEGKTPLRHVSAQLISDVLYGADEYYIGNIDPNSQVPISLRGTVRGDVEPGNYSVKVLIKYYDVFYNLRTREYLYRIVVVSNVSKEQVTPQPLIITPNVYILVGVIFFVVTTTAFYLLWFRRRVGRGAQHT
jgi:hypothetical protein